MKKYLICSLVACALLSPLAVSAQKKVVQPILKTAEDSLSYALGTNLAQNGLIPYLTQLGALTDTVSVAAEYDQKIAAEQDAAKKDKLNKELKFKIDSINNANIKNMDRFLAGFEQTIRQKNGDTAFNTGISLGSQLGTMTKQFSTDVLGGEDKFNMDAFIGAFAGSLKNETPLIDNTDQLIQSASQKMMEAKEAKEAEALKGQYAQQIAEGNAFMEKNKTAEGVVTLPSGLQYKVVMQGFGETPTASDRVKVHYKGTLLDGTVFDNSYDRGEPITFGVTQVIKGWTEALQLMPVGSKWMLYIPYDLAYGSRDQGTIKPFSNLIFEVELMDIVK
ncbi:FKBP-type peptidyl-prolyl cis-trans isomerase FklB [Dysgonomonas sp. PFB1-18]|uniref:FKBP-type peptidyl-prolyl cis-trans isomerase n=1 Tax=unclassified Dysgonomonas TaxID=2630389 RepID=UPI002474B30C|nr:MULTISPECIES: FKBP-type peptidyl-prolyl cis-trans isomerase [unclassified Dysgonomonas]MDH6307427.1 FKBP-type peptidyl-prolyl cis-trans isomerase FklB [Dysgonomonas sp. PF1-14]MDH6337345.1 FKBP-type peptidyl-prolyl cis-trans isomerase FklB [Dysgonomonas sp. PF1-16]MDH6379269.1 FKBP-type peptidyl-prolyl cis-trans isomerase FklB [Dysgonomonas sp. PFB1-18]MDH6396093.1 FKBP-type peptidyl-prolyl cis-trans isomerase FklB [Dysgonomonas sp. PF1-23]